jgi:hypothetical protein
MIQKACIDAARPEPVSAAGPAKGSDKTAKESLKSGIPQDAPPFSGKDPFQMRFNAVRKFIKC